MNQIELVKLITHLYNEHMNLAQLEKLTLKQLIEKANPFIAYVGETPEDFIHNLLVPKLIRSEATCFGIVLEKLALMVCPDGEKTSTPGLDLDIRRRKRHFLVPVKSGSGWGNSQSHAQQQNEFTKAKKTIRQTDKTKEILATMGICYGTEKTTEDKFYADYNIVGQNFWYFLTGEKDFYKRFCQASRTARKNTETERSEQIKITEERLTKELKNRFGTNMQDIFDKIFDEYCENWSPDDLVNYLLDLDYDPESSQDWNNRV